MKYLRHFNEDAQVMGEEEAQVESNYDEVLQELKEMVESTIQNGGGEYNQFLESFLKDPEEVKIEGLINDSDIYDFYLKHRNQIDECLNGIDFYNTPVEELNITGLYDFVIVGTKKSVEELIKILSEQ
jgi:hypothetical protein